METLSPVKFATKIRSGELQAGNDEYFAAWIGDDGKINHVDSHGQFLDEMGFGYSYRTAYEAGYRRLCVYVPSLNVAVSISDQELEEKHRNALFALMSLLKPDWMTVSDYEEEHTFNFPEAIKFLKER